MLRRLARRLLVPVIVHVVRYLEGGEPGHLDAGRCEAHGPWLSMTAAAGIGHLVWLTPAECRELAKNLHRLAYEHEEGVPVPAADDDASDLRW